MTLEMNRNEKATAGGDQSTQHAQRAYTQHTQTHTPPLACDVVCDEESVTTLTEIPLERLVCCCGEIPWQDLCREFLGIMHLECPSCRPRNDMLLLLLFVRERKKGGEREERRR